MLSDLNYIFSLNDVEPSSVIALAFDVQYVNSAPLSVTGSNHCLHVWIANERIDTRCEHYKPNIYNFTQRIPKISMHCIGAPIFARALCLYRFHRATLSFTVANCRIFGNLPYRAFKTADVVTPLRPQGGQHFIFVFLSNQVLRVKSLH